MWPGIFACFFFSCDALKSSEMREERKGEGEGG